VYGNNRTGCKGLLRRSRKPGPRFSSRVFGRRSRVFVGLFETYKNPDEEWIGTELTFDLKPENASTVVLFAERAWKEQVEFMHYCSTKWAVYLLSLKSLCETGIGRPFPDDLDIG